jgi:hypothetical protein
MQPVLLDGKCGGRRINSHPARHVARGMGRGSEHAVTSIGLNNPRSMSSHGGVTGAGGGFSGSTTGSTGGGGGGIGGIGLAVTGLAGPLTSMPFNSSHFPIGIELLPDQRAS